ncbi:MAG: threonine synthase [Gammaproteobacteria bacterium]|nr:threonine synthase [Gammaproteobacteria bacterium]
MNFISTRSSKSVSIEQALLSGTADDGGLYLPNEIPKINPDDFIDLDDYAAFSTAMLYPYFRDSLLEECLDSVVSGSFNFPIELSSLDNGSTPLSMLELYHGPTAAFKDYGARFLAACSAEIHAKRTDERRTILVATSGDTGGAVASAFYKLEGFNVIVLFPNNRVSPRQQQQLTCWGNNVTSLAVNGGFDDCQRLVKEAFSHQSSIQINLASANSINIGRLLPQATYYAWSSMLHYRDSGQPSSFIVPTGNMGNSFACFIAKKMGFPIEKVLFATNSNQTIYNFSKTGEWSPSPSIQTYASAMDVGNPSNMERFSSLYSDDARLSREMDCISVSNEEISQQIKQQFKELNLVVCPHTATAFKAYDSLKETEDRNRHWVIVSTAHPAKFENIVESIIQETIDIPTNLMTILEKESVFTEIDSNLSTLKQFLV